MTDDISGIVNNLKLMLLFEPADVIAEGNKFKAAGERLKAQMAPISEDLARRIDLAVAELERQDKGLIILRPVITTSGKQGRWYFGPSEHASPNWYAYRDHLREKGWSESMVQSIDNASTRITNELLCPNGTKEDRFQGLVLGYVQSGKTASMAATIAKAADSGYRMIIVLAGLTNVLRRQTQIRLHSDVLQHNPSFWLQGTNEQSDFQPGAFNQLPTAGPDSRCSIFVIKKNANVLKKFKRALNQLPKVVRKSLPTLIIDDECDQASINTAAHRNSVTQINSLIRDICDSLSKVTYVGYTATPYANVLMGEASWDGSRLTRDLYPSEFIVSLDEPDGYFGARRLFGDDSDAENDSELPFIRRVPEEDIPCLQPGSRNNRDTFSPSLTRSLSDACDYFLLALAARRARGQEGSHCCMLIHTTIYAICHRRIRAVIRDAWLYPVISALRNNDENRLEQLRVLWERESQVLEPSQRDELDCPERRESFSELILHLQEAANSISIIVENSESELDERLDFNSGQPVQSIVIGGNVLARGLTIEGLVCSYFIRSSSQYDTLMQMGRWFGYRRGYEDLPRIWMTRSLEYAFRDLVSVEQLIRSEIDTLSHKGWTPSDVAIRVPQIAGLSITARNKLVMENLEECEVSYYGSHEQTISFRADAGFHLSNWNAGAELVSELMADRAIDIERRMNSSLFRNVSHPCVLKFLRSYQLIDNSPLSGIPDFLSREIENGEVFMETWNIGIIGSSQGKEAMIGSLLNHPMVTRSKVNPRYQSRSSESFEEELKRLIYIKALMGAQDLLIDVDRESYRRWMDTVPDPDFDRTKDSWRSIKRYRDHALGGRPLLLLYPIDRESKPKGWSAGKDLQTCARLPLLHGLRSEDDLPVGPLGIGVVFPEATKANARHFLRVKLNRQIEGEALDDADYALIENSENDEEEQ